MPEFIRLIESTYREVPPPKPKKQKERTEEQKGTKQSSTWLSRLFRW